MLGWVSAGFPADLESRFLANVCAAFRARAKAIRHQGGLLECRTRRAPDEVVIVSYTPLGNRPSVVLTLSADNRADVYVRSNRNRNRGAILGRVEGLLLVDNAPAIVAAYESTLGVNFREPAEKNEFSTAIGELWRSLGLEALGSNLGERERS